MSPWSSSRRDVTPDSDATTTYDNEQSSHEKLSLWQKLTTLRVNPVNNKCMTLPILKLNNPYSINFHL
jgi:NNP family nitrate/nitrite transporter-like MFS transporter